MAGATIRHIKASEVNLTMTVVISQIKRLITAGMSIMYIRWIKTKTITPATLDILVAVSRANISVPVPLVEVTLYFSVMSMPCWIAGYPHIHRKVIKCVVNAKQPDLILFAQFKNALTLLIETWPGANNYRRLHLLSSVENAMRYPASS